MDYLNNAKTVFKKEIECLTDLASRLGNEYTVFVQSLDECSGKLIWSGIGKSGHICKKIVATMQSLGIPAVFLHPSEALHGDLGIINAEDIVILVSNSGETKELLDLTSPIHTLGARVYCIVGKKDSTLERNSDLCLSMGVLPEVYLDLVPTASTTATLVIGDAIAVGLATSRAVTKEQFGLYHPSGQLGKRLTLTVEDIMIKGDENSTVHVGSTMEEVIFEMCKKSIGAVSIIDSRGQLKGIFTDGDLRRHISQNECNLKTTIIDNLMVTSPIVLHSNQLLQDAITHTISKYKVSFYPVVDDNGALVGTVRSIDVLNTGLIC